MKQTTKIILHSTSHLLLFGSVIFAVSLLTSQHQQQVPPNPPKISAVEPGQPTEHKMSSVQLASTTTTDQKATATTAPKYDELKATVQQEYVYHLFAAPNDPRYSDNWALTKTNALAAWNISTGNGQTIVAVIDGGVALAHEDLTNQWFTNNGETGTTGAGGRCWTGTPTPKQTNNCDDDNNGYVDDWRGWNFIMQDNDPQTGRQNPTGTSVQHGSTVAGLVGAAGNNGTGIATLNWNTKIMPLQALSDDGLGYTSDVTAAVYYAVDNGAQVINLSLGTYANDPAMKAAVDYATARGVVLVAAAGNCGDGGSSECDGVPGSQVAYPAAYPTVIAVGASTASDQRASFSSYGQSVDVVAPGYALSASTGWSAGNPTSQYSGALYGTSFATPQVSSLAALIKSIRPSSSVADITALIEATATKPASMSGLTYTPLLGHGIINAGSALSVAQALNAGTSTPTLLQAGSFASEHSAPSGTTIGSGCQLAAGVCTVQLTNSAGHKRFLPYAAITSGATGWSWSSDMLDSDWWEIRARSGDSVSTTPYYLLKK